MIVLATNQRVLRVRLCLRRRETTTASPITRATKRTRRQTLSDQPFSRYRLRGSSYHRSLALWLCLTPLDAGPQPCTSRRHESANLRTCRPKHKDHTYSHTPNSQRHHVSLPIQ